MWSTSAHSHLSSHGFLPAGTLLVGHSPPQPPGLRKVWGSPHCAHSSSWTGLSTSACAPWGGIRLPPIAVVPMNGPGPPSLSQALRKHFLSYCVFFFFFFLNCPETCSPTLVLGFPGLALPGPGDKYPLALSPAYHLIPHWSDPVC